MLRRKAADPQLPMPNLSAPSELKKQKIKSKPLLHFEPPGYLNPNTWIWSFFQSSLGLLCHCKSSIKSKTEMIKGSSFNLCNVKFTHKY